MGKILFTGGGTAGHVTPNIALIEALAGKDWQCHYVGSRHGIERSLMGAIDVPYHAIHSGKLRRYFAWRNFIDPLFILLGVLQSLMICLRLRPDVVFSKGGFVAVPVVFAAWLCRIPVISHESDMTPGLANKLCLPFSRYLCVNFAETTQYLSVAPERVRVTGSPLRKRLRDADADRGRDFLDFNSDTPILLVVGGSLGARALNEVIGAQLSELLQRYQIVHLVGAGNLQADREDRRYRQFEYLGDEYGDVLAAADLVISRAGANSVYELIALRKPHLLVPLPAAASRGDQLVNARVMATAGMSLVLQESELGAEALQAALRDLENKAHWQQAMQRFPAEGALDTIIQLIEETARHR